MRRYTKGGMRSAFPPYAGYAQSICDPEKTAYIHRYINIIR